MFDKLIIPVAPRENWPVFYYAADPTQRHNDDAPTVAETFLPYTTAPIAPSNEDDKQFSYGKLWRAYAQSTALLLEM